MVLSGPICETFYIRVECIIGVRTKRLNSPKVLKVEYLKNVKCYTKYDLLHFHRKLLMSTTTSKTCQTALTSNPSFYFLWELVDESVIYTNSMKMSRRPSILKHISILDVQYNLNFLGVDVKGRSNYSEDPKSDHSKTGIIRNPDFLEVRFRIVRLNGSHYD